MRDVSWEDIFKLGASAAASEFCEWVQVGIDVCIPHRKYEVKLHSSPWFSAACAAAVVQRKHFFCLYQKDKSSHSKVKFRQASNCCKRVLEAANIVLNKGKSAIPPLFSSPEVLSSTSDKVKLLKTFLRTLILMALVFFTCFPF